MRLQPCLRSAHSQLGAPTRRWNLLRRAPSLDLQYGAEVLNGQVPALLPTGLFTGLPAISKWFKQISHAQSAEDAYIDVDHQYLEQFGDVLLPLEYTTVDHTNQKTTAFERAAAPLSIFLAWSRLAASRKPFDLPPKSRLYLAQASISSLPPGMRSDVPAPEILGAQTSWHVCDSSVWIGLSPTFTPLHRDPNANLFVQLAGKKKVRVCDPTLGAALHSACTRDPGDDPLQFATKFRNEDMMIGTSSEMLRSAVWDTDSAGERHGQILGYEAELNAGDGLFIPKGWWHSFISTSHGISGSVNWWFR